MDIINYSLSNNIINSRGYFEGVFPRYFLTFDPVLNSYGELDTAFQPSGDFEIEVTFLLNSLTGDLVFVSDGVAGDEEWLRIDATNGSLDAKVNGLFYSNDAAFTADNNLNIAKFTRIGSTLTITLNGSTVGSHTVGTAAVSYKMVGRRGGVTLNYFDGIISNVKLTDLSTPVNSRIFPLDTLAGTENSTINTGSITINNIPAANRERFTFDEPNNRWVGEELVTNGGFDTDTGWTKGSNWTIADGKATSNGATDTGRDLWQYSILVSGSTYRVSVDIVEYTQGDLRFWAGFETYTITEGLGSYVFDQTYTNTGLNINSDNAPPYFTGSIDNVSVKRLLELA